MLSSKKLKTVVPFAEPAESPVSIVRRIRATQKNRPTKRQIFFTLAKPISGRTKETGNKKVRTQEDGPSEARGRDRLADHVHQDAGVTLHLPARNGIRFTSLAVSDSRISRRSRRRRTTFGRAEERRQLRRIGTLERRRRLESFRKRRRR